MEPRNVIGVIGGTGFSALFDGGERRSVSTPYGPPSSELSVATIAGATVAFVARHGSDHRFAPQVVPYRANLWALRSVGVHQVVSLSAVGSLRPELPAGTLVVPDQLVDRTHGREHTYFGADCDVHHISFADPFCPRGRRAALSAGPSAGAPAVDGGTLVVVNGPRFSSRAESLEFQSHGWSIIGMTAMPEAALARELALCYTTLALVTDLDAGVEAGAGVTQAEVLAVFAANRPRLRELLFATVAALSGQQRDCPCADTSALPPSFELPG